MLLVALFVIVFFAQAVWAARKHRIERKLDALVFAMMFLSVPATRPADPGAHARWWR
jgi:hypothetical protein